MSANAQHKAQVAEHLTVRDLQQEVHKLHEEEFEGKSAATPLLAIAGVMMVVVPAVVLLLGLCLTVAHLA